MSDVNYEMVYKVRRSGCNTSCLSNLEIGLKNKAVAEAQRIHGEYLEFLRLQLGPNVEFEVTNVACMADDVIGHVYVRPSYSKGSGHRKCCYCGCDDFD